MRLLNLFHKSNVETTTSINKEEESLLQSYQELCDANQQVARNSIDDLKTSVELLKKQNEVINTLTQQNQVLTAKLMETSLEKDTLKAIISSIGMHRSVSDDGVIYLS